MASMNDKGLLLIRLGLGLLFVIAGFGKMTGILGPGISGFAGAVFGSALIAWIVAIVELLGGIALLLGFYHKYAAYVLAVVMAGAIVLVHGPAFSASDTGTVINLFIHISLVATLVGIGLTGPGMLKVGNQ